MCNYQAMLSNSESENMQGDESYMCKQKDVFFPILSQYFNAGWFCATLRIKQFSFFEFLKIDIYSFF